MSIPEGQKGHCSLCDQRLGFPPWCEPVAPRVSEPKTIRTPPNVPLPEDWKWAYLWDSWGAQAVASADHCYYSKRVGLLACVGKVPAVVKVAVANANGCSPI